MTPSTAGNYRRSIRLKGYDYSQPGAYFVTICTQNRECLFGEIENGKMQLNAMGDVVNFTWNDLVNHVAGIELGPFGIMPNHVHGIIEIHVGAGSKPAQIETGLRAGHGPARTGPEERADAGPDEWADAGPEERADARPEERADAGPEERAGHGPAPTGTGRGTTAALSEVVRQFKTFSARRVNALRNAQGVPVWQRNYWEHIIRDEKSYEQIAAYILNNPQQWEADPLIPEGGT